MIKKDFFKRLITSLVLIVSVVLMFNYNFILLFMLLIFGILSIIEFFNIIKKISKNRYKQFIQNFIFIIFIFTFCLMFFFFTNIPNLKIVLFILLFGCFASDIGGYLVGRTLKGPKLTSISPKKTISGALGSIFFSIMMIKFYLYY